MTPLYFGTAARRLFGVYAPPRPGKATRAAVLCHPWGQEYIRAHRSMRLLANLLCNCGYHVLRFDYFGTGDSAGEAHEGSLSGWEQDIETALEEVRDTSGASRVTLIGLRLGASLAARVAARRRRDVDALLMWDPIVDGQEYLIELLAQPGTGASSPADSLRIRMSAEGREVRGFLLSGPLEDEIRAIDLTSQVDLLPRRTRLVSSAPLASHAPLRTALTLGGRDDIQMETIEGLLAWHHYEDLGAGAVPHRALEALVRWLR